MTSGRILADIFPIPEATAWLLFTFRAQGKSYFCRPKIVCVRERVKKKYFCKRQQNEMGRGEDAVEMVLEV